MSDQASSIILELDHSFTTGEVPIVQLSREVIAYLTMFYSCHDLTSAGRFTPGGEVLAVVIDGTGAEQSLIIQGL